MHFLELIKLQLEHKVLYQLANVVAFASLDKTHFSGQAKMRLISQLIKGIPRVLQKLIKYFNGTIISTFFVPPLAISPVIFCLHLNEALLLSAAAGKLVASKNGLSL